jgi:hypothetical protein
MNKEDVIHLLIYIKLTTQSKENTKLINSKHEVEVFRNHYYIHLKEIYYNSSSAE